MPAHILGNKKRNSKQCLQRYVGHNKHVTACLVPCKLKCQNCRTFGIRSDVYILRTENGSKVDTDTVTWVIWAACITTAIQTLLPGSAPEGSDSRKIGFFLVNSKMTPNWPQDKKFYSSLKGWGGTRGTIAGTVSTTGLKPHKVEVAHPAKRGFRQGWTQPKAEDWRPDEHQGNAAQTELHWSGASVFHVVSVLFLFYNVKHSGLLKNPDSKKERRQKNKARSGLACL